MKISQLIEVLEKVKEEKGDKHIWDIGFDYFPLPEKFEMKLVEKIKKTDFGFSGGKAENMDEFSVYFEYDDETELVDSCFGDCDDY